MITKEEFLANTTDDELWSVVHCFKEYFNGRYKDEDGKGRLKMLDSEVGKIVEAMIESYEDDEEKEYDIWSLSKADLETVAKSIGVTVPFTDSQADAIVDKFRDGCNSAVWNWEEILIECIREESSIRD